MLGGELGCVEVSGEVDEGDVELRFRANKMAFSRSRWSVSSFISFSSMSAFFLAISARVCISAASAADKGAFLPLLLLLFLSRSFLAYSMPQS